MATRLALLLALGGASGCALREAPYRFRAPLVGAVQVGGDRQVGGGAVAPSRTPATARAERPVAPPITAAAVALAAAPPAVLSLARPRPRPVAAPDDLAARLRAQVGSRRADDSLAFALAALAGREGFDPSVAGLASPTALVALARERRAEVDGEPRTGDLLVFGPLGLPDERVAVVVSTGPGGTIEFVYLTRGIVRRGVVTPGRPGETRDRDGRALNTFVRGFDPGDPRGARYLASDVLVAIVDRGRLLGPAPRLARRR